MGSLAADLAAAPAVERPKSDDFNARAAKVFHREYRFHLWNESEHTVEGEDWSLPPTVRAASYSGMLAPKAVSDAFPGRIQRSVKPTWRSMEPEEGRFDFAALRAAILEASEQGRHSVKIGLGASVWETRHFRQLGDPTVARVEVGSAPRWLTRYGIPIVEERPNASTPFQVVNFDIYHPEYHRRYLRLVEAFGRSGIPQMKELDQCYLHLRSASRGEEGSGPASTDPNRRLYEERLRAWAAAFKGVAYKLCNVSGSVEDIALCNQLGMGQRNGFVEHYLLHAPNPALGQELDPEGYLVVNEQSPIVAENRASGDENEEYQNEVRFGPLETFPHRYHESMLRALQMRRNFLWAETGTWLVNPPLLHYVALELGQTVRTAPDAWCYLRESRTRKNTVKNFERWLFQRDGEGARTVPTEKVEVPAQMFEFDRAHLYDYTARRTDRAHGQTAIRFGLDDAFLAGGPHRVAVKITYLDRAQARWALAYQAGDGSRIARSVTCGDTGKTKTVTFLLPAARFPGRGYRGVDLEIQALEGDAVVRLVRVIKLP